MIADGYGGISAGRTRIRLSQEKLAAMLSLTRQTTNQLLKALQADGVVRHVGEIGRRRRCAAARERVARRHALRFRTSTTRPPRRHRVALSWRLVRSSARFALSTSTASAPSRHPWPVFIAFLRLGLTSFGGPVAHLGYFRTEFVTRRGWLTERTYADLVGLCQFLPRPASSRVGMAIGLARAGYAGMFAAWLGFTLPSALLMMLFALGVHATGAPIEAGALHGLRIVSVAVIAQAVWGWRARCARMRAASR